MPHAALDRFGQLLMQEVRDRAIEQWEQTLDGRMKGESAQRVCSSVSEHDRALIKPFVPSIVDTTLHWMLCLLDGNDDLRLAVDVNGSETPSISAISDGLPHELGGTEGWIAQFSRKSSGAADRTE